MNKFLKDHTELETCSVGFKGEITVDDIYRMWVATASIASGEVVAGILPHSAPSSSLASLKTSITKNKSAKKTILAATSIKPLNAKLTSVGSNAWAIGRDGTSKGNSVHLYNPHFPWEGIQRQYMVHVTIPGELNVMGVTLGGFPLPFSGFTEDIGLGAHFLCGSTLVIS